MNFLLGNFPAAHGLQEKKKKEFFPKKKELHSPKGPTTYRKRSLSPFSKEFVAPQMSYFSSFSLRSTGQAKGHPPEVGFSFLVLFLNRKKTLLLEALRILWKRMVSRAKLEDYGC